MRTVVPERAKGARNQSWRLLDTAGGIALGILLTLGLQWWTATPHSVTSAHATAAVSITANTTIWEAGPWQGCVLAQLNNADVSDGQNSVTHQVSAVWSCPHSLPPALLTPTPAPTPTTR